MKKNLIYIGVLTVVVIAIYISSLKNGFTNWDDPQYVVENEFINDGVFSNAQAIFGEYHFGHYHPVTWISLAIDYSLGGGNAFMFHLSSLLLHLFNTILIFLILRLLLKNDLLAVFLSLIWAIHPMQVESVSWISERKNVLFAFFFFLSLYTYIKYIDKKDIKIYILSVLLFIVACFSKSMAITLSISLPLIDYIKGRPVLKPKVLLEKVPYLTIAFIFGLISIFAQAKVATNIENLNFFDRFIYANTAFWTYVFKLILPVNLSALYPYTTLGIFNYLLFALTIGLVVLLVYLYRKAKVLQFAGISFFIINIFFVLKLFNVPTGPYLMADRYVYVSAFGILLLFAGLIQSLDMKKHLLTIRIIGVVFAVFFISQTIIRTTVWKNSIALWENVLDQYPGDVVARVNYANALKDNQQFNEAILNYDYALKKETGYVDVWKNKAFCQYQLGEYESAVENYKRVAKFQPDDLEVLRSIEFSWFEKSNQCIQNNDFIGSVRALDSAIKYNPNNVVYYVNRGISNFEIKTQQTVNQALIDFRKAEMINPSYPDIYFNRAMLYAVAGEYQLAINDLLVLASLQADNADIYLKIGALYYELNEKNKACEYFEKAKNLGNQQALLMIENNCKNIEQ